MEIWVIDDNNADRKILNILLEEIPGVGVVHEFGSGNELFTFLDRKPAPEKVIVFCDEKLGKDNGVELLDLLSGKIRQTRSYKVLMSGGSHFQTGHFPRQIDTFMLKKSDLDEWRADIHRLIDDAFQQLNLN